MCVCVCVREREREREGVLRPNFKQGQNIEFRFFWKLFSRKKKFGAKVDQL